LTGVHQAEDTLKSARSWRQHIAPISLIVMILIAAYHRLFLGATFLTDDDPVALWGHAHGNAIGNGWRPDKGLGISFFFGDPGAFHPWSVWSLWERLFTTPYLAFDISIMLLVISAAIAQYSLLLKVVPRISPVVAAMLATLIILGPLQSEFFFQRHWITLSIGTPLVMMLSERHFRSPRIVDYFLAALLVFGTLFLGSIASLEQLLVVGAAFAICYATYYRQPISLVRYLRLILVGGVATAILGAWTLYPIALEAALTGYVRDPRYVTSEFLWTMSPLGVVNFAKSFFLMSWFPNVPFAFPPWFAPTLSWTNASVVFPLIAVVVMCWRPTAFWPWTLKRLFFGFLIHEFLFNVVPAYEQFWGNLINLYPLGKFQQSYHVFEICLLAFLLQAASEGREVALGRIAAWSYRLLGVGLLTFYTFAGVFVVLISAFGYRVESIFKTALNELLPAAISRYSKEFLVETLTFNAHLVSEVSWQLALAFFLSGVMLIGAMQRVTWRQLVAQRGGAPFAILLIINGLFLSWFVLPLNAKGTVWQQTGGALPELPTFAPTDRFYRFSDPNQIDQSTAEKFRRGTSGEFGTIRTQIGYLQAPALNLSGLKPYTQTAVAEFVSAAFNNGSSERLTSMRGLIEGPLHTDPLLNLAAVSHYYSDRELAVPNSLELIFKTKQLYVYRNRDAWPYIYLARRSEATWVLPQLLSPGTAYSTNGDNIFVPEPSTDSLVELAEFNYGDITISYANSHPGLLVVADAWHPFWRASVDSQSAAVVKVNGVFKGIPIPAGKHEVKLWFDTTGYRLGIYISIVGWTAFILGIFMFQRRDIARASELATSSLH
jgi:hypothetical protein